LLLFLQADIGAVLTPIYIILLNAKQ